jgi:hypothetical protein
MDNLLASDRTVATMALIDPEASLHLGVGLVHSPPLPFSSPESWSNHWCLLPPSLVALVYADPYHELGVFCDLACLTVRSRHPNPTRQWAATYYDAYYSDGSHCLNVLLPPVK